jgi:hypothetical protein
MNQTSFAVLRSVHRFIFNIHALNEATQRENTEKRKKGDFEMHEPLELVLGNLAVNELFLIRACACPSSCRFDFNIFLACCHMVDVRTSLRSHFSP